MALFNKPNTINQVWASNGIITSPVNLKISQGWTVEIPPYQYFNWSQNRVDSFMAHVNQMGIPVWDPSTEYQGGKSYVSGSNGIVYKAKSTNINKDPADSLNSQFWVQAFETYGVVAPVQAQLNKLQTDYNTLANIANYPQARTNLGVFSKTESDVRFAYKAGTASQVFSVAFATQASHAIPLGQLNDLLRQATTTIVGVARMSTQIENEQGTLDNVIVSPATGNATYLRKSQNLAEVADKAASRANLGITDVATKPEGFYVKSLDLVAQVAHFARITAPTGWLVCDGSAVSRTQYSDLFDAIGTLYGAGDGTTTFNLPDCRKEYMRSWDGNVGSVGVKQEQMILNHGHTASAALGGSHTHTGNTAEAGAHVHPASSSSAGVHNHSFVDTDTYYTGTSGLSGGNDFTDRTSTDYTSNAGAHTHQINISSAGQHSHPISLDIGGAHSHDITILPTGGFENRPRSIQFLTCIRY